LTEFNRLKSKINRLIFLKTDFSSNWFSKSWTCYIVKEIFENDYASVKTGLNILVIVVFEDHPNGLKHACSCLIDYTHAQSLKMKEQMTKSQVLVVVSLNGHIFVWSYFSRTVPLNGRISI